MVNDSFNILLIEDNDLFRKTLVSFINKNEEFICNYSYRSCEDALRDMELNEIVPDIILLDIGLPGITGVDGIPFLKKISPVSRIIMLTIQEDDSNIFRAICNGAAGYLLKDASPEKIIESIKEVISGGSPMNASIAARVLKMFREFAPMPGDYDLTKREKEILKLVVDGLSKKQIAVKLFLSYHTIDSHIRNVYEKLNVHTLNGAVSKALKENLI